MEISKAVIAACEASTETWHRLAKDCQVFNYGTRMETTGHIIRAFVTFGTSSLLSAPQIERSIENQSNKLEASLYEFKRRVQRAIELDQDGVNIYEALISAEISKYGENTKLACGFVKKGENFEVYECNIGEVAFHLIEARKFWNNDCAKNSVQDISGRYTMVCKAKRALGAQRQTPELALMPSTPLSEKIKKLISTHTQKSSELLFSAVKEGANKFAENHPRLGRALEETKIGEHLESKSSRDKMLANLSGLLNNLKDKRSND